MSKCNERSSFSRVGERIQGLSISMVLRNAAILVFSALMASSVTQSVGAYPAERIVGVRALEDFDYQGVRLDEGPLKSQFDEVRSDYLRIPDEDLLKGFRKRAGLPASGRDLGGWYSSDTFHIFGQILSGLARMYAATGDPRCLHKAENLLSGWSRCVEPDGFFYFSRTPNAPCYTYDKMVGGLVDLILYCHSDLARRDLERITRWAEIHLGRDRRYAYNAGAGDTEWYTLSENLYRAYLATGDRRYKQFAEVWEYREYWDIYSRHGDIFARRPNGETTSAYHAYSHVNTLGGLGASYLVTGKVKDLDALKYAYDFLQKNECFVTGGYGPDEQLLPSDQLAQRLSTSHNTFETQCGSWAAFKMAKYLITCTGDAKYGDWIEKLVFNGIGASIPMASDGRVFYYSDYNIGSAQKRNTPTGWTCCAGTRPMAVADYHDLIYFRAPRALFVNLYTPSTVTWNPGTAAGKRTVAGRVQLVQTSGLPSVDQADITVNASDPIAFTLGFRRPEWARKFAVEINGKSVPLVQNKGHWLTVRRVWIRGDHVRVKFGMAVQSAPLSPGKAYPAAYTFGPVVLAFDGGDTSFLHQLSKNGLSDASIVKDPDVPLGFRLTGDSAAIARPFQDFKEDEPYLVYLDPAAANHIGTQAISFNHSWNDAGGFRFTNQVGASATFRFRGDGIRWLGFCFDDAGIAKVEIDGSVVKMSAMVDQYGPGRNLPFDWKVRGLGPGEHFITITVTSEKNPLSTNRFINIAGFELLAP